MAPDTPAESNWAKPIVEHRSVAQAKERTRRILMSPPAKWNDEARRLWPEIAEVQAEEMCLPEWVIRGGDGAVTIRHMLTDTSSQLADVVEAVAPSVVQVRAGGRAASGLVYQSSLVLTTGRVIGRDEHPEVRTADGRAFPAEIAGWDPASRLVLLKVPDLTAPVLPGALRGTRPADGAGHGDESAAAILPRVGSIAIAIGRSMSNNVTATAGLVSVIGGPLPTGPRRQLDQVIRISAPVHSGFAGGAVVGADGSLIGVATAAAIRGLTVVIPADIAWDAAKAMIERGGARRGYLGIAAQPVRVPERQRGESSRAEALLVVGVKDASPAADAGLLVGDLLLALDEVALASPEDLIDLLVGDRVGRTVTLQILRGGSPVSVPITPSERS
jgi:S1-C subfamily serine protease